MLGNIARTTSAPETTLLRVLPEVKVSLLTDLVNQAWETEAISYWATWSSDQVEFKRNLDGVYEFTCYDFEDDDRKPLTVNVNTVRDGLERLLNRKVSVHTELYAQLWFGVQTGVFDTDACDVVVQAGLFGDIVYG